jgi:hypothetical protein
VLGVSTPLREGEIAAAGGRDIPMPPGRLVMTVPRPAHTGKLSVHAAGGTGVSGQSFTVVKTAAP